DPRQLFEALPDRAERYQFLRDPQGQVLESWFARRTERDLVIKMNTGGGKTVVGLVVCQSSLHEDAGPALYVAPDPYLADQAAAQARDLGLEVTTDPRSTRFADGQAICVISIKRLINGKTVFGSPGGTQSIIDVGTAVVDDTHAALSVLEEQTTLRVRSQLPAYRQLVELFEAELRRTDPAAFLEIEDGLRNAVVPVPFWLWTARLDAVAAILHSLREDEAVQWRWPLVKGILPVCQVVLTADAVEIRPPCPPIDQIVSFDKARRRVYLTATLADDSVLVTDFDANPTSVATPITPAGGGYLGDRLILAPQELNATISDNEVRAAARSFADAGRNVVVLAPSHYRARLWDPYSDVTASTADQIAEVVAELRSSVPVGLVVLVNKYDGIDLPEDACRVLVIDGLPESYGGMERRERMVLGDSEAMVGRQLQRIEQGMGRGVRSTNDYCAVLLMGAKLSQRIASPVNRAKLGPATRAQLELSREVAAALAGRGMADLAAVIDQVLERDRSWVTAARDVLADVVYGAGSVSPVAIHRRRAFNHAAVGQYSAAATEMSQAVSVAVDDRHKGWLQEQLAAYQHFTDQIQAQRTLAGSLKLNRYVLRPREGVSYQRLKAGHAQAVQAAKHLSAAYSDANSLRLGFEALLDDLVFDPERVPEFEAALEHLGEHLGFTAQRPERDSGNGPDVLWALGDLRYLLLEAKSGVQSTRNKIWRSEVEQLAHSANWFAENYDYTCAATPVLVHPTRMLESNATAPPNTRIMTPDCLQRLREAVTAFAVALTTSGKWANPDTVAAQLHQHHLAAGQIAGTYSATTVRGS
ncbi:DEAD/DEAH box helicase, partial [Plantactinospora sp. S1510]